MTFWQKRARTDGWAAVIFGTDSVAVAEIARRRDGRPRVRACEGFARDGSDLDVLKRLKGAHRLSRAPCATLLRQEQYKLLQIDAPENVQELSHEDLREASRWLVKEMIDFPIEEAGIDVIPTPAYDARAPQLWVVVASHDVLQSRVRLFQDAGVRLDAIDIPDLAQRNLAALFEEPGRGLALVSFDDRGGRLTINFNGELFMVRHIDVGAPDLLDATAGALRERALLDIQRTLDNFDRNYSAIPLTHLLVGPLPGGTDFIAYLGANLPLPVKVADLADVLDIEAVPQLAATAAQSDGWLALGAALREQ